MVRGGDRNNYGHDNDVIDIRMVEVNHIKMQLQVNR